MYEHVSTASQHILSIFERLSQLEFKIHEVGYQKHFIIDGTASAWSRSGREQGHRRGCPSMEQFMYARDVLV
jgi:hypothetical protein